MTYLTKALITREVAVREDRYLADRTIERVLHKANVPNPVAIVVIHKDRSRDGASVSVYTQFDDSHPVVQVIRGLVFNLLQRAQI